MGQPNVTTKIVAGVPASTLPTADLATIVQRLDAALAAHGFVITALSDETAEILKLAWSVALYKKSVKVTAFHLAYALIKQQPEQGLALAEALQAPMAALSVGCILKLMALGTAADGSDTLGFSADVVRWLAEAGQLSAEGNSSKGCRPDDLVQAVQQRRIDPRDRSRMRSAAITGITHFGDVDERPAGLAQSVLPASQGDIVEELDGIKPGTVAEAETAERQLILVRLDAIDEKSNSILKRLITVDQRSIELEARIPRPPSAWSLATGIVATLLLGSMVGLALASLQPGSRIAQFVWSKIQ